MYNIIYNIIPWSLGVVVHDTTSCTTIPWSLGVVVYDTTTPIVPRTALK